MSLPARCPAHPQAHVIHTVTRCEMLTNAGGYVGPAWVAYEACRCAVCAREVAAPKREEVPK